jgi:hypothetical protein
MVQRRLEYEQSCCTHLPHKLAKQSGRASGSGRTLLVLRVLCAKIPYEESVSCRCTRTQILCIFPFFRAPRRTHLQELRPTTQSWQHLNPQRPTPSPPQQSNPASRLSLHTPPSPSSPEATWPFEALRSTPRFQMKSRAEQTESSYLRFIGECFGSSIQGPADRIWWAFP